MARILGLDEVRERLDPVTKPFLINPWLNAIKRYRSLAETQPDVVATFSSTTRANVIHDFVKREVRGALPGAARAREIEALEFFTLAIGADLIVRFKFVAAGRPSNVRTDRQVLLAHQAYSDDDMGALALEGLPEPPTAVTSGYTLDYEQNARVLTVQCDYGRQTLFRYVVWGDGMEGGLGNFETRPLRPDLGPDTAVVRSARAKKSDEEAQ